MNLGNSLRIANIMILSSIRQKRSDSSKPTGFAKKPITNFLFAAVVLPITAVLVYQKAGNDFAGIPMSLIFSQLLIFIPSFMTMISMIYSIMFEFSQSSEAAGTDMLNWLPVTPGDFVLGSSLNTVYYNLPMSSLMIGATLGLALKAGMIPSWLLAVSLGLMGGFMGAFTLEIVRSFMNRISGAFSSGGQSKMLIRLLVTVSVIVTVSMFFNLVYLLKIIEWFSVSLRDAWFIPMLWPSLVMMNHLTGEFYTALIYTALSIGLTASIFWLSARARSMNWVPAKTSYKIVQRKRASKGRGFLGYLGLSDAEAALIGRDFKALIRRRELMTLLSIPLMMFLMAFLNFSQSGGELTSQDAMLGVGAQVIMGVIMFNVMLSLTAIGREGKTFINLQSAPIDSGVLAKSKIVFSIIPSLLVYYLVFAGIAITVNLDSTMIIAGVILGGTFLVGLSILELIISAMFPDFNEVPRARFILWQGSILGMLTAIAYAAVIMIPVILSLDALQGVLSMEAALILSEVIALAVTLFSYRVSKREVSKIYVQEM